MKTKKKEKRIKCGKLCDWWIIEWGRKIKRKEESLGQFANKKKIEQKF